MKRLFLTLACVLALAGSGPAGEGKKASGETLEIVRIGAVASVSAVTVFKNLKTHLNRNGYPSDYVLYSSYDALVDALDHGEIDIAWNSPLSHAQYHLRNKCTSQTLAMREGDINLRHVLVARADAGIRSLADLPDKRVILDKSKYQHELVSTEHLKAEGVNFDALKLISGENGSPAQTLKALEEGRADAAVVRANAWEKFSGESRKNGALKLVWTSPAFNHCVFTAAENFDKKLGDKFTSLITTMDPNDPLVLELNRLERTRKWLPGDSKGFESLDEREANAREPADGRPVSHEREDVATMLGKLKPKEREVIYLHYVSGYTAQEIGESTNRPRNTVLSLLSRARKKLERMANESETKT